jgi:hypothetical protein
LDGSILQSFKLGFFRVLFFWLYPKSVKLSKKNSCPAKKTEFQEIRNPRQTQEFDRFRFPEIHSEKICLPKRIADSSPLTLSGLYAMNITR